MDSFYNRQGRPVRQHPIYLTKIIAPEDVDMSTLSQPISPDGILQDVAAIRESLDESETQGPGDAEDAGNSTTVGQTDMANPGISKENGVSEISTKSVHGLLADKIVSPVRIIAEQEADIGRPDAEEQKKWIEDKIQKYSFKKAEAALQSMLHYGESTPTSDTIEGMERSWYEDVFTVSRRLYMLKEIFLSIKVLQNLRERSRATSTTERPLSLKEILETQDEDSQLESKNSELV